MLPSNSNQRSTTQERRVGLFRRLLNIFLRKKKKKDDNGSIYPLR